MSGSPWPKAVLFDLYNTLVPGGTRTQRDRVSFQMADLLGVDRVDWADLVRQTFDLRTRGHLGDLAETVRGLAARLGAEPSKDAVNAAVELRLAMTRQLHESTWAVGALIELGRLGLSRGLVSDCSAETPTIWPQSPLSAHIDAVSFSCETGHRKPEPAAYLTAVSQLGVDPHECVFIGDGASHELTGAAELGMTTYRMLVETADQGASLDMGTWTGPTCTNLDEWVATIAAR